ncbi:MAG: VOC family protein [Candidatus Eisenbacteria bacterium]|nr:VOC family protein [Candidatus Eisenbacteria bacterium]
MRFGHVELFIQDIAAARVFYEQVLGAVLVSEQAEGRILWFELGGMEILLRPGRPVVTNADDVADTNADDATDMNPDDATDTNPGDTGRRAGQTYRDSLSALVLYTDDLAAEAARLRGRGVRFEGDDGPGCLTFRDPDGNWFQLTDPSGH